MLTLGLTRVTLALRRWIVYNDSLMLFPCASTLLVIAAHHDPPATRSLCVDITVFTRRRGVIHTAAICLRARLERARMGSDEMSYTTYPDHNEESAQGGYVGG